MASVEQVRHHMQPGLNKKVVRQEADTFTVPAMLEGGKLRRSHLKWGLYKHWWFFTGSFILLVMLTQLSFKQ